MAKNLFQDFLNDYHTKRNVLYEDAVAAQTIRILDVLLFGPFLIYMGCCKELSRGLRIFLVTIAVLAIIYNVYFYIKYEKDGDKNVIKSIHLS